MPTAATITAASKAAIMIVRLEGLDRFALPRRAPERSISGDAVVDFCEPFFFPEVCLG